MMSKGIHSFITLFILCGVVNNQEFCSWNKRGGVMFRFVEHTIIIKFELFNQEKNLTVYLKHS